MGLFLVHNFLRSNIEDPVVPLQRNLCGHPLAGLLWERQFEKVLLGLGLAKSIGLGMFICSPKTRTILIEKRERHQNCWKKAEFEYNVEEIDDWLIFENQHHSLTTCVWDALNVGGIQKDVRITNFCKSNREKNTWEKSHAKTVAWSYDMEGHASKCPTQRLSNCTGSQRTTKTSRKKNWKRLDVLAHCLEVLVFGRNW